MTRGTLFDRGMSPIIVFLVKPEIIKVVRLSKKSKCLPHVFVEETNKTGERSRGENAAGGWESRNQAWQTQTSPAQTPGKVRR